MSYFQGANNFSIQTLNILNVSPASGASPGYRADLYSKVVAGAIHDSNERCDAPKCHPETREAVQKNIIGWIRDGDQDVEPMKIMLTTGPAGSGKTAIAGSVAETCDEDGLLAATFFFSSFSGLSDDRRLKRGLITTLVHQLTQLDGVESVERHVLSAIQRNPRIFDKRLKSQMEDLVLKPLRDRHKSGAPPILAKVIIIDGLDEVEHPNSHQLDEQDARSRKEAEQEEILRALHHAASDPIFPFRVLIVSRPERVIRDFFSNENDNEIGKYSSTNTTTPMPIFDCFSTPNSPTYDDVTSFLHPGPPKRPLSNWSRLHLGSSSTRPPSLVIRFLQDNKPPDPQGRLQTVLSLELQSTATNPLAPLDALESVHSHSHVKPRSAPGDSVDRRDQSPFGLSGVVH